ncbi:MAG: hypothetical protein ACLPKI_13715 [Streptosporangiaceae bacterium]
MRRIQLALLVVIVVVMSVGVVSAATIPHTKWKASAAKAVWKSGGFLINNNMWNPSAGPQTIWADSYDFWGVQSAQRMGDLRVKSFPEVERIFKNVPVSSLRTLRNGFTQFMPALHGQRGAEAADDVWLDNSHIEVMIWVDNEGQTPAGHIIAHATISGQHFAVWNIRSYYVFALDHNEHSGQTNILASLRWLINHHYIPASVTLGQVGFGWEIAYTGGVPRKFVMTRYWLTAQYS